MKKGPPPRAELNYCDAKLDQSTRRFFAEATQIVDGEDVESRYAKLLPDEGLAGLGAGGYGAFVAALVERLKGQDDYTRIASLVAEVKVYLELVEEAQTKKMSTWQQSKSPRSTWMSRWQQRGDITMICPQSSKRY